jgi:P2 family phage contractile tail tube protein
MNNILRNFNLFVDGTNYAGQIEEINLPKPTVKTEEHRVGGMDAPIALDMGMEALKADFTLTGFDPRRPARLRAAARQVHPAHRPWRAAQRGRHHHRCRRHDDGHAEDGGPGHVEDRRQEPAQD